MIQNNREIEDCLSDARASVQRSDEAGANGQEAREIRAALRALIQAVAALRREVARKEYR